MISIVRRSYLLCALLLAVPAMAAAQSAPSMGEEELPAALNEVRASLGKAFSELAPAAVAEHFAADIQVQFGPQEFRGRDAATAWIHDALTPLAALQIRTTRFDVTAEEVVESANYSITIANGEENSGTLQTVWRIADGKWTVHRIIVQ